VGEVAGASANHVSRLEMGGDGSVVGDMQHSVVGERGVCQGG
jgi:hypothetical protein